MLVTSVSTSVNVQLMPTVQRALFATGSFVNLDPNAESTTIAITANVVISELVFQRRVRAQRNVRPYGFVPPGVVHHPFLVSRIKIVRSLAWFVTIMFAKFQTDVHLIHSANQA